MENPTELNRGRWAVQLALTIGLALLFLAVLLWGVRGVTPARADPGALYVDGSSGQDTPACGTTIAPCQTISYTLNSRASDGDTIFIATGTYTENLTITGITLTLRGGYTISGTLWVTGTSKTIINGNSAGRVLLIANSDTVLDNLTITGGQAPSAQCWGGGAWITGGDVTIRSSTITGNAGDCGGAGIEVNSDWGPTHLTLESSTVSYNTGGEVGGIAVGAGTTVTISDSQIYSNTALGAGGGVAVGGAVLNMSSSSVTNNNAPNGQSGGIDAGGGSTVNVLDSVIADNSAKDHGGAATVVAGATLNLTNTLITGNSTTSGNANAFGVSGDVTIMNCTISDNNPQGAQAVILWSGHFTITNSILWNNALNLQGDPPCPTCFTVTYSDIEGGWAGTDNIKADPLFVGEGNYRLQMDSPCIDAGTNTNAPDHDLDQKQRPQDGDGNGTATADMGAYEFGLYRAYLPLAHRGFGP